MLTTTREKKEINKEEIKQLQTKAAILDDLVGFIEPTWRRNRQVE